MDTHVFQCTKKRSYADIQMIQKTDLANITDSKYRWCYIYINTCRLFDVIVIDVDCLNRRVFSVILFAMVGIVCMLWLIVSRTNLVHAVLKWYPTKHGCGLGWHKTVLNHLIPPVPRHVRL